MENKEFWLFDCDTGVNDTLVRHYFMNLSLLIIKH